MCQRLLPFVVAAAMLTWVGSASGDQTIAVGTNVLSRVRLKTKGGLMAFDKLEAKARDFLTAKNMSPPANAKPVFDILFKGKVFIYIYYPQGLGKKCWHVSFDNNGEIVDYGVGVVTG